MLTCGAVCLKNWKTFTRFLQIEVIWVFEKASQYGYLNFELIGTSYGSNPILEYVEIAKENNTTFKVTESLKWFVADATVNNKMIKHRRIFCIYLHGEMN